MWKNDKDFKNNFTQLDLPFESNIERNLSSNKAINIIEFSSKVQSSFEKEKREMRKKSAEFLLNYAAKLDW